MPGRVIAIGCSKGGSGKSTTTALLATAYQAQGLSVALLDADPQAHLAKWFRLWAMATGYDGGFEIDRKTAKITGSVAHNGVRLYPLVTKDDMRAKVAEARAAFDLVLIDLQGAPNNEMVFAFGAADLIIVPAQASGFDLDGLITTTSIYSEVVNMKERLTPYFVLLTFTGVPRKQSFSGRLIRQATDAYAREQVGEALQVEFEGSRHPVKTLNTELNYRQAFKAMSLTGLPPSPKDDAEAARNQLALAQEVALVLQGQWQPADGAAA